MSDKYKFGDFIPTEILAARTEELADAVVSRMNQDISKFEREFTCRIPAEMDRDADLVLHEVAKRLLAQQAEIERLKGGRQWISVDERLPEPDEHVVTWTGKYDPPFEIDYIDVCPEYGHEFFANGGDEVTHWMKIEPPKEQE